MSNQAISPTNVESGSEYPKRVSAEEYLEKYAHDFYEWDDGELVKMSPVTAFHANLSGYLYILFKSYFRFQPIGVVMQAPFLMRVDEFDLKREPDLQVILNDNPGQLTETAMLGPTDICIEIVSPESAERDYGKKLTLYEKAGVKEYWLFDYLRKGTHFYRLNDQGFYELNTPDANGNYETPLLPGLKIHVPTLWTDPLPDVETTLETVRSMLRK